jgi:hypothetical protein
MRGFVSYLIAGILVVLTLGMIAPLVALSPVGASPAVSNSVTLQAVDRTNKGDRVPVTIVSKQKPEAPRPPALLAGCDPAFSPLAASTHANFARSCIG